MDSDPVVYRPHRSPSPAPSFAIALALTMSVAAMVVPSIGALSSFIVDELSITRTQLGWLFASVSITSAVLAPTSGRLADRYGGRQMLLLLLTMGTVVLLGLAIAPVYWVLVVFATLAGGMNSIGNPASNRLIASELPVGSRGLVMGVKQSGIPFGIFLAGLIFPLAAEKMGWRSALGVASLVPAAILLFVRRALPTAEGHGIAGSKWPTSASAPRSMTGGLPIASLVMYSFLMGMGDVAIIAFGPLYLHEALNWSVTLAGQAIALAGGLGIGARILWSRWAEGRDRLPSTLIVMATSSFCAGLSLWLAGSTTAGLVWVGVALFGTVSLAWNAIVYLLAINAGVAESPGRASGYVMFGFMSGSTVGPVVFGYTVDLTGTYNLGWAVVLSSFALAGFHVVRSLRN